MPINITLLLLVTSLMLTKANARLSRRLLLCATLILAISSIPYVADKSIYSFEKNYESFSRSSTPVDYIIVLGCGHHSNDALPATSQLKPCSLSRLVEAIRIYRLHPEAQIITSGSGGQDEMSNAEKVKNAAIALGVPENKILLEVFPKDTREEAQLIAPRVKGKNTVLVTDAYHLPRAMKYFALEGVTPIPAPAGFYVKNIEQQLVWQNFLPQSQSLVKSSIAWYEAMGQLWQWIAY